MQMTNRSLTRTTPEQLGIAAKQVIAFLDDVGKHKSELHSFMLLRHGQVAAEDWWAPYAPELPHMLFSLSKSFTSTAIGMAVHEGIITLDDAVVSFFPDDLPGDVPEHLGAMQIRHLLMMGTGHDEDTMDALIAAEDGHWVRAFLELPVPHEPGTHFLYNTGATYMLSAILQKASGQSLMDYLTPRLFKPLGIENPTWDTCPRGINTGGYGLNITTEDIAKLGQLYLQRGLWNGVRIMDEEWVHEATRKQISNGDGGDSDWAQGYGYQFWRCRHGIYRGDGAFGQFCLVMPEQDAVIAITSGTGDMQAIMNSVWDHLLPGFLPEPIAEDESSVALGECLAKLHLEVPKLGSKSMLEAQISGTRYEIEQDRTEEAPFPLKNLCIKFDKDRARLDFKLESEDSITLGREHWLTESTVTIEGKDTRTAGSFTWKSQDELILTLQAIETPFCITLELHFVDDAVTIHSSYNVGWDKVVTVHGKAVN
ncbi:serine hydrolase [Paenibacillus sp. 79R4]|uniref:serine hydrolase domain-containing protein n=1 Tax=Paenibacillus sp. 79R4 TaxID=2212847 RepID=UPI0015BBA75E|nr:serine hydrolase [Paenibacillus sp. 79R4]NWL86786.1 serine hydrolase [Paenibacillus sp. 79R4]